jgi:hypothetical protein
MAAERVSPPVPRPIAGLIFVVFWAIAIVLWCLANTFSHGDLAWHAFIVDIGLVFAFAGFSALFVETQKGFVAIFGLSIAGIVLFAVGDLLQIQLLTYSLRILGIALAFVIVPITRLTSSMRVLS